jgi:hypothetical protein
MGHGIIAWIIIGIVAGWITGKLVKGSGFGAIMGARMRMPFSPFLTRRPS